MASFAGTFGLQPMIGRQLAIIDDLRIGPRTDRALITERLLTISGGGYVSIDRKYLGTWQGELPIKFLIISNEVPSFADDSGALASRFVVLNTQTSFYGREDRELTGKLLKERGGILLWALEGLRTLREHGRFIEANCSADMRSRLATAASPIQSFIEEFCELDPGANVRKDTLYQKYVEWQKQNDQPIVDKAHFAEALIAAGDGRIKPSKRAIEPGGYRVPHFVGIQLQANGAANDDRLDGI
jgi:phage/plasmid-associated DNA primase